jgi:tRNA pseudouridine38-40 synthase
MALKRNICLTIAFDGTSYNGWQRQLHDRTIQGEIERCLTRMTNSEVTLHGAGRTDAGVHAEGMTANFQTDSRITATAFRRGLNSMLPEAIRIIEVKEMPPDFHARFSAKGKHYQYSLYIGEIMPPLERLYRLHVPFALDLVAMQACLDLLLGTHDFSTFENAGSREKDKPSRKGAVRCITEATLKEDDPNRCAVTIIGEGFLRHMVRNIVGTLLEVGLGRRSVEEFKAALLARDRNAGGATAPPHGLKLIRVLY